MHDIAVLRVVAHDCVHFPPLRFLVADWGAYSQRATRRRPRGIAAALPGKCIARIRPCAQHCYQSVATVFCLPASCVFVLAAVFDYDAELVYSAFVLVSFTVSVVVYTL